MTKNAKSWLIANWLRGYSRAWLRVDVIAGLAALNPDLLKMIERSALGKALGHERMFFNLQKALEAYRVAGAGGKRA